MYICTYRWSNYHKFINYFIDSYFQKFREIISNHVIFLGSGDSKISNENSKYIRYQHFTFSID